MNEYENNNDNTMIIVQENNESNNALNKIKKSTKMFWNKNKNIIIFVGGCCIVIAGTVLTIDNVKQRKLAKELSEKVFNQKNKINYLYKQNSIKDKRIKSLEKMCIDKDNFFKRFISDGTRRGDSECARQLAYRKQYLKKIS